VEYIKEDEDAIAECEEELIELIILKNKLRSKK